MAVKSTPITVSAARRNSQCARGGRCCRPIDRVRRARVTRQSTLGPDSDAPDGSASRGPDSDGPDAPDGWASRAPDSDGPDAPDGWASRAPDSDAPALAWPVQTTLRSSYRRWSATVVRRGPQAAATASSAPPGALLRDPRGSAALFGGFDSTGVKARRPPEPRQPSAMRQNRMDQAAEAASAESRRVLSAGPDRTDSTDALRR